MADEPFIAVIERVMPDAWPVGGSPRKRSAGCPATSVVMGPKHVDAQVVAVEKSRPGYLQVASGGKLTGLRLL